MLSNKVGYPRSSDYKLSGYGGIGLLQELSIHLQLSEVPEKQKVVLQIFTKCGSQFYVPQRRHSAYGSLVDLQWSSVSQHAALCLRHECRRSTISTGVKYPYGKTCLFYSKSISTGVKYPYSKTCLFYSKSKPI